MVNVLIVEDSRISRESFERQLAASPDFIVLAAIENAANAEIACMSFRGAKIRLLSFASACSAQ